MGNQDDLSLKIKPVGAAECIKTKLQAQTSACKTWFRKTLAEYSLPFCLGLYQADIKSDP